MVSSIIRNNEKYHAGDTITITGNTTCFGFTSSSGTAANVYLYLPKEIDSNVRHATITGSLNFYGNVSGRTTNLTIGNISILRPNVINIQAVFPSGVTRTGSEIGALNVNQCTIQFT